MKKVIIVIVVLVVAGIGWYAVMPLFNNKTVDEALPTSQAPGEGEAMEAMAGEPGDSMMAGDSREKVQVSEPVPVVDTAVHPASGQVRVVKDGAKTYIRYENFKTINGPDVRIYLANDLDAKDYVEIGKIKATEGNINYEVPAGVNVDDYRYVLHWCDPFKVLFNSADLSQTR